MDVIECQSNVNALQFPPFRPSEYRRIDSLWTENCKIKHPFPLNDSTPY